eukprot:GEMP01077016.1.p1 GENE.GEMP01077016.1~~GEMP01077016.1.p1  ORF type:complete len:100 (+),score=1.13 GEMP01077016.1:371-670(+)
MCQMSEYNLSPVAEPPPHPLSSPSDPPDKAAHVFVDSLIFKQRDCFLFFEIVSSPSFFEDGFVNVYKEIAISQIYLLPPPSPAPKQTFRFYGSALTKNI